MSTRTEQYDLTQDAVFQGRVAIAALTKAVTIATESAPGLNTPRNRLAVRVLRDAIEEAKNIVFVVVRDTTIAAKTPLDNGTVSDTEIDSALSDVVWDRYAEAFS